MLHYINIYKQFSVLCINITSLVLAIVFYKVVLVLLLVYKKKNNEVFVLALVVK